MRPAGDPLAEGHQGARARCATSTTTSTDIVPTILDVLRRSRCPDVVNGVEQIAAAGRLDALHVRRRRRADARRSASTTRCSARAASGRRAGRPSPCTGRSSGMGNFDEDEWELFHIDEDRSEAHDLAEQHPEKLEAADRALVRGGGARTTCCRSTTASPVEILDDRAVRSRSRRATRTSTTRARPRCRRRSRPTSAAARTRSSPRSRSPTPTPRA